MPLADTERKTRRAMLATTPPPAEYPSGASAIPDPVRERVRELAEVASQYRVALELEELVQLLPENGPADADSLRDWIRGHPGVVEVDGRWARSSSEPPLVPDPARRARAERYWRRAVERFGAPAEPATRWLRFLGVTGSAAYRDAGPTDDCDLMAIVRPGALWAYLAVSFASLRLRRLRGELGDDPNWCLNYVLTEPEAEREYGRPRGFLFAREALTVRPVLGSNAYRQLLDQTEWLREELPRLYTSWGAAAETRAPPACPPPGLTIRCLNGLVFPWLAAYLQVKGLWVNYRLRRAGQESHCFQTLTRPSRMALATTAFARRAGVVSGSAMEERQWSPRAGDSGAAVVGPSAPPSWLRPR